MKQIRKLYPIRNKIENLQEQPLESKSGWIERNTPGWTPPWQGLNQPARVIVGPGCPLDTLSIQDLKGGMREIAFCLNNHFSGGGADPRRQTSLL